MAVMLWWKKQLVSDRWELEGYLGVDGQENLSDGRVVFHNLCYPKCWLYWDGCLSLELKDKKGFLPIITTSYLPEIMNNLGNYKNFFHLFFKSYSHVQKRKIGPRELWVSWPQEKAPFCIWFPVFRKYYLHFCEVHLNCMVNTIPDQQGQISRRTNSGVNLEARNKVLTLNAVSGLSNPLKWFYFLFELFSDTHTCRNCIRNG